MKNWKTTLGGSLVSIGAALQLSDNGTLKLVGGAMVAVGALILGFGAKDNNVTGGTTKQ